MDFIEKYDFLIVSFAAFIICSSFVGAYPIYILDEARNSEAAREILVSGNYIVPYFNGQLRTDKPPLHYFFMTLGYKLFGINSFGARFFSGVFGALTILMTYWGVKRRLGNQQAWIVALILLSSLFFVQEFHLAVPDPYLIFFVSVSLFCFFDFYVSKKRKWLWLAYIAVGLGVLTKGPIAVVLPVLVIPVFLLLKKDFNLKSIFSMRPISGLLLVLAIASPWYYLVHEATQGKWTQGFFFDHNISRFSSEKEGHGGLFILTPLYVVLGLLPFSVFIIQGFANAWLLRKNDDFILFSFVVSSITILFFSIASTKLPNYPMPCYPFMAVLIGSYLHHQFKNSLKSKTIFWSLLFLLFISLLLPIGGFIALTFESQFFSVRYVSLFLLVTTLAAIFGFYFYKSRELKKAFLSIAGGWIFMGFFLFGIIYPVLTTKSPVSMAMKVMDKDSHCIIYKRFDSAFPINYNRTFKIAQTIEEVDAFLKKYPDAFIVTNTRQKEELAKLSRYQLIMQQKALFENHITRIYSK